MDMPASPHSERKPRDTKTSSDGHASRFAGPVGLYMLSVQEQGVLTLLQNDRPLSGRLVLDVGGGHAQLAGPLLKQGCKVSVAGSDARCALRVRQLHGGAIAFYEGDLTDLPILDRVFDTVISVRLISHMDNWPGLVSELCRIADKTILIDYPTYASLNLLSLATFPLKKRIEKNTRTYRSFWGSEIQASFARHGFKATANYRQFTLPMALHRLFASAGGLHNLEAWMRKIGVTALIGNPVLMRFDRTNK